MKDKFVIMSYSANPI